MLEGIDKYWKVLEWCLIKEKDLELKVSSGMTLKAQVRSWRYVWNFSLAVGRIMKVFSPGMSTGSVASMLLQVSRHGKLSQAKRTVHQFNTLNVVFAICSHFLIYLVYKKSCKQALFQKVIARRRCYVNGCSQLHFSWVHSGELVCFQLSLE